MKEVRKIVEVFLCKRARRPVFGCQSACGVAALKNEKGVAVVVALLVLLLLSVMAVTLTDTTTTEKRIVRSEAVFERTFFRAESGAMESVQKLANESEPKELLPNVGGAVNNAGLIDSVDVDKVDGGVDNNEAMLDTTGDTQFTDVDIPQWDLSEVDANTYRRVVLTENATVTGHEESLDIVQVDSKIYDYLVFGYSDADNGNTMIKIRYRKIVSL